MKIREFQPPDVEQVIELWKEGKIFYEPWDKKENLLKKHEKDPDLFIVAEENEKVIGVVIGQYDGWGTYIHHLTIKKEFRNKGIGTKLMDEIENRLKERGGEVVFLFTFPDSKEEEFVKERGYKHWGLSGGWEKKL